MSKVRKGKTERKRANGAFSRNESNKAARVAWQHDSSSNNKTFPAATCNGRKNRSVIVIKKNEKRGRTSA